MLKSFFFVLLFLHMLIVNYSSNWFYEQNYKLLSCFIFLLFFFSVFIQDDNYGDYFTAIPLELLLKIFSNLTNADVKKCRLLCKRCNTVIVKNRNCLPRPDVWCRILVNSDSTAWLQLRKLLGHTVFTASACNFMYTYSYFNHYKN